MAVSSEQTTIPFLAAPTEAQQRKQILGLCESYSHSWDLVAELLQNAVDAVRLWDKRYSGSGPREHRIDIAVDASKRSVTVSDTGTGISPDQLPFLLAPHSTDKDSDADLIGEKGVGITYTVFSSNVYRIKTAAIDGSADALIRNAASWKNRTSEEAPAVALTRDTAPVEPRSTGTTVEAADVEKFDPLDEDLFSQSANVIAYIIRTRTAIGNTGAVFGNPRPAIHVSFTYTDADGKTAKPQDLPFRYVLPTDFLKKADVIDYSEFLEKSPYWTDREKREKLKGKTVTISGSKNVSGRVVHFYGCFVPSRRTWTEINKMNGLYRTLEGENVGLVEPGLFVANKGMPTGIVLPPPQTGAMNWWANLFILIEDNGIVFDVGRKHVPSRTQGVLKKIAQHEIFREMRKISPLVGEGDQDAPPITANPSVAAWDMMKEFESLIKRAPLGLDSIPYARSPDSQEAAVVAIFHELLGARLLRGYVPLKTGYKETYDLWALYRPTVDNVGSNRHGELGAAQEHPTVIEFKFAGEALLGDIEEGKKFFADIDLVVCWDFDPDKMAAESVDAKYVAPNDRWYDGATHEFNWPGSFNLGAAAKKQVIVLRRLIEELSVS